MAGQVPYYASADIGERAGAGMSWAAKKLLARHAAPKGPGLLGSGAQALKSLGQGAAGIVKRTPGAAAMGLPLLYFSWPGKSMARQQGASYTRAMASQLSPVKVSYARQELEVMRKQASILEKQAANGRAPGRIQRLRNLVPPPAPRGPGVVARLTSQIPQSSSTLAHLLADPKRALLLGAALVAGGAAAGAGVHGIGWLAGRGADVAHRVTKNPQYKRMVKADPTLEHEPRAKQMFEVLHRASPYIAKEPVLAAATVRTMLEQPSYVEGGMPNIHPDLIQKILQIQETRGKSKHGPLHPSVSAAKNVSLPSFSELVTG